MHVHKMSFQQPNIQKNTLQPRGAARLLGLLALSLLLACVALISTGHVSISVQLHDPARAAEYTDHDAMMASTPSSSSMRRRLASDFRSAFGLFSGSEAADATTDGGITNLNNKAVLQAFTFGPEKLKKLAYSVVAPLQPTDKVTTHTYHTMYGIFLYPLLARARKYRQKIKFFEIGMGCGMTYGPGRR